MRNVVVDPSGECLSPCFITWFSWYVIEHPNVVTLVSNVSILVIELLVDFWLHIKTEYFTDLVVVLNHFPLHL